MENMFGNQNLKQKIIYEYGISEASGYAFAFLSPGQKVEVIESAISYAEKIPENISLTQQYQVRAHRIHNLANYFDRISLYLEKYTNIPEELSVGEKLNILKNDHEAAVVAATLMTNELILQTLDSRVRLEGLANMPIRGDNPHRTSQIEGAKKQLKYYEEIIGTTETELLIRTQQSILYFLSFLKTDPETELMFTRKQDDMCEINIGKAKDSPYSPHCIIDEEESFNGEDSRILKESILSVFDFENYKLFREKIILPTFEYKDLNDNAKLLNIILHIKDVDYPYPIGDELEFTKLLLATVIDEFNLSANILHTISGLRSELASLNRNWGNLGIYSTLGTAIQHLSVTDGKPVTFKNHEAINLHTTTTPEGLLIPTIRVPLKSVFDKNFSRFLDVTQLRNKW